MKMTRILKTPLLSLILALPLLHPMAAGAIELGDLDLSDVPSEVEVVEVLQDRNGAPIVRCVEEDRAPPQWSVKWKAGMWIEFYIRVPVDYDLGAEPEWHVKLRHRYNNWAQRHGLPLLDNPPPKPLIKFAWIKVRFQLPGFWVPGNFIPGYSNWVCIDSCPNGPMKDEICVPPEDPNLSCDVCPQVGS